MDKITREDWDFIFNTDDPEYEQKFNKLVIYYIEKTEKEIAKMKDSDPDKKEWLSQLNSFKYFFKYENWITVLPTDIKIALTETAAKNQRIQKCVLYSNCWDIIGMTDDFARLYKNLRSTDELGQAKYNSFRKLYEIQEKRASSKGIIRLWSKIPAAFRLSK